MADTKNKYKWPPYTGQLEPCKIPAGGAMTDTKDKSNDHHIPASSYPRSPLEAQRCGSLEVFFCLPRLHSHSRDCPMCLVCCLSISGAEFANEIVQWMQMHQKRTDALYRILADQTKAYSGGTGKYSKETIHTTLLYVYIMIVIYIYIYISINHLVESLGVKLLSCDQMYNAFDLLIWGGGFGDMAGPP